MNKFFTLTFIIIIQINLIANFSFLFAQKADLGIRVGTNQSRRQENNFRHYEFFLINRLPFDVEKNNFVDLNFNFESTVGLLDDGYKKSVLFSVGPMLYFGIDKNTFSLMGGVSPSLMTNHTFRNIEFGGTFNFISHIAVLFSPIENMKLGYRFEHISNARIYESNPGINIHFIEIHFNKNY